MENKNDRVIAIDYLRGICILAVIINHATVFSTPIAFLTGEGKLWTTAAAMFFLLSGVTFGIVRSKDIMSRFGRVLKKSLNRALQLYVIYIIVVLVSMLIALNFSGKGLTGTFPGYLPSDVGVNFLYYLFTLRFSYGFATYLMYYSVILLFAPFALYSLKTKYWPSVLAVSAGLFLLTGLPAVHSNVYGPFLIWQFYFFIGLTIARFRLPILNWFHGLPKAISRKLATGIVALAAVTMLVSALLTFDIFKGVYRLTNAGILPAKIEGAYIHLLKLKPTLDGWLQENGTGLLRPLVGLLVFTAIYVIYQRYKTPLLKWTGNFVNTMGSNTLSVFVAQALVIPLFLALPIRYGSPLINIPMTILLIGCMWLVTQRQRAYQLAKATFTSTTTSIVRYIYALRTYLVSEPSE